MKLSVCGMGIFMRTKIYVMTHKEFEEPTDDMYVPVHVGREMMLKQKNADTDSRLFLYVGDNTGDNISAKNCYYSELTGLYWVWKNVSDADIVGACHYRRYLLNEGGVMFTGQQIEKILDEYDLITTKNIQLNNSYYEGFSYNHKQYYLDETKKAIKKLYPEYYPVYDKLVNEEHTFFGNMFITSKPLYDKYMEWLFSIFFEMEKELVIDEEDAYHRRIYGFISEFLLLVWTTYNNLKVYECLVGMIGEKAETGEVKRTLAQFFRNRDYEKAGLFFLKAQAARPDITMEASDITGELHICMQIIATAGLEQEKYQHNILDKINDYKELIRYFRKLNHYIINEKRKGVLEKEAAKWIEDNKVTDVALMVSRKMYENL